MKNKGDDIQINIENLKCCGNCRYGYNDDNQCCCSHPYNIHTPEDKSFRCQSDWKFDETNWIDRIVEC